MATTLYKFDNYTPPCPSSYDATIATMVDSGRNVNGYVVGGVVRDGVASISIGYSYITIEDWANLLQQFEPTYGGAFYRRITFFNPITGKKETRTFYVSDRNSGMFVFKEGKPQGWTNATLSLVER